MTHESTTRREFLSVSAASFGSASVAGAFHSFLAQAGGKTAGKKAGYGSLAAVADETTGLKLLRLPQGFRYLSYGWTNDAMSDSRKTPNQHDGMAVIAENRGTITLCRNHEVKSDRGPFTAARKAYDPNAGGGCVLLKFNASSGEWKSASGALSGTVKNCAGGPTPWNTWLSCEEIVSGPGYTDDGEKFAFEKHHGWIFEVPADGKTSPTPLKDMGRFVHEAVAVDPKTGYVYETEDRGQAGFYRFIPHSKGELAKGGKLEMLKVKETGDLRRGCKVGQTYDVSWVPIDDPTGERSGIFKNGEYDESALFKQGKKQQAATFARLEGCWYGNGLVYLNSTSGGDAKAGQVWSYDPANEKLKLIFESPSRKVLDKPDNITVSPRGGLVLCEDGDVVPQRMHGMTPEGRLFSFAENNVVLKGEKNGFRGDYRGQEWAGATFSRDGKWLFVNIQTPGMTFAITGPWEKGGL